MFNPKPHALDNAVDGRDIDRKLTQLDYIIRFWRYFGAGRSAVHDACRAVVVGNLIKFMQNLDDFFAGIFIGFHPLPIMDIAKCGVQSINQIYQQNTPFVHVFSCLQIGPALFFDGPG